jgi:hypothetical protein
MPFHSSKVQSKFIDLADFDIEPLTISRPSLNLSFLNIPSAFFHALAGSSSSTTHMQNKTKQTTSYLPFVNSCSESNENTGQSEDSLSHDPPDEGFVSQRGLEQHIRERKRLVRTLTQAVGGLLVVGLVIGAVVLVLRGTGVAHTHVGGHLEAPLK